MELFNILAGCKIGTATIPAAITNIFHTLFLLVKWGVPILLVIWGSWDLGKAVMAQKEDEIKKGQQMFVKRLITAVIVFLVFFIVQLVVGLVSSDTSVTSCAQCFINADETACRVVQ